MATATLSASKLRLPGICTLRSQAAIKQRWGKAKAESLLLSFRQDSRFRMSSSKKGAISEAMLASILEDEDDECELVTGKEVHLGSGSEVFDAYLARAVKNPNGASILLLSDVEGHLNSDTQDFAYRLACLGFSVLIPDLFRGDPWIPTTAKVDYEAWRAGHPAERVAADIHVAAEYLYAQVSEGGDDQSGKIGLMGFCFGGGRLIETLAADSEGRFSAGVFFYGTRFDPSLAETIKVPLLLISGDSDPLCSADTVAQVEKRVKGSQALVFNGRGHGFAHHPSSVEDDEDAETAFTAAKHWLQVHLLGENPGSWLN